MPEQRKRNILSRYLLRQMSKDDGRWSGIKLPLYVFLFAAALLMQSVLPLSSEIKGILAQLQVLISVWVTISVQGRGYRTAVLLNLGESAVLAIIVLLGGVFEAVAGAVIPVITVLTITILEAYQTQLMNQLEKEQGQREELTRLNEELQSHEMELDRQNRQLTEFNGQLMKNEQQLHYLTFYDALTSLPNRDLILRQVDLMINLAAMTPISFPLMNIDLDHFSMVNEKAGHKTGDCIFSMIATRLQENIHPEDMLGRFGNDGFILVVQRGMTHAEAEAYAERLRLCLHAPFIVEGDTHDIRASIGVAFHPDDAMTTVALLRAAELALRCAKESGRDAVRFHAFVDGLNESDWQDKSIKSDRPNKLDGSNTSETSVQADN